VFSGLFGQNNFQDGKKAAAFVRDRESWAAIAPDPKTPKGALRVLILAAQKNDQAGVRRMLTTQNPDLEKLLDGAGQLFTSGTMLWNHAVDRFGEVAVTGQLSPATGGILTDQERELMTSPWQPTADGGLDNKMGEAVRKQPDGTFKLDLTPADPRSAFTQEQINSILASIRKLDKLMSQVPPLTIDQIKSALAEPTTRATAN
jgi:hypothetical protein